MKNNSDKQLKYSLFFFFVCAPLESISIGESFSLAKLSAIVVLFMWVIKKCPIPNSKMVNSFYILLGYALLSSLWSIDIANSIHQIIMFLIPSILVSLALSASIKSKEDIRFYLKGYVIGCVIAAFFGFYYRDAVLSNAIIAGQERLTALGADQNALAYLLAMGVACLLSYYLPEKRKWYRMATIALIGAFSLMILSTGSRTGMFILLIVIGGYLLSQKNVKVFFFFVALIAASIPFVLNFLPEAIIERFTETNELVSSGNFSERGDIWLMGMEAFFQENFVFGVGYSNFTNMIHAYFGSNMASHNTYITYLTEFGIIGIFVFLNILVLLFQYAKKISRLTSYPFIYFYVIPLFVVMLTLETEYKRWIFILGILLESWYNMSKKPNYLVK